MKYGGNEILGYFTGLIVTSFILYSYHTRKKNTTPSVSDNIVTSAGAINNPGNIRKSGTVYQGEILSPSDSFKSFSTMAYGYRAMIKILRAYYTQGYKTLSEMIYHYAPPSDNNPSQAYVNYVSANSGVGVNEDMGHILNTDLLANVVFVMSKFEQGNKFTANLETARLGYNLA